MSSLVDRLAQLIVQDNAILFVGASLRLEEDQPPLVQQIAEALAERIQYERPDRSLPSVARDFEVLRGRNALILALREELEKLGADQPLPIYQLIADAVLPRTKILTTHFDRALEQALEQFGKPYVLIVRDTDLPFFDESKITLIKMQGDLSQPDSLVITEDDIDAFISKLPTVSDVVRAFFATKTLIFLGYDLNSDQFKRMFRQATRELSSFRRQAYAILPHALDEVEIQYWRGQNVETHVQDPIAFLEDLAQAVKESAQEPQRRANPLAQATTTSLPARPYKGLDSFTDADEAIFSSRLEESYRLTNRILAHRQMVLYGESGSGKTSLLQAGAGPRLARNRALLVTCAPTPGQSLLDVIHAHLVDAGLGVGLPEPGVEDLPAIMRVWQKVLDGPIVLGVDQFEQFFLTYGSRERQTAVDAVKELLDDRSLDMRLVLVVREDFLGRLQTLETSIPGLLDVRFRLERLGREAARAAIEEPARLFNVTWEPALVQTLLDDLYEGHEGGVAPPQLQIVCDHLYQRLADRANEQGAGDEAVRITQAQFEELGGTPAILGEYLDGAISSFHADQGPRAKALLGALVSSAGVKQRLALDDLARSAETTTQEALPILDELIQQRLVRRFELPTKGAEQPRSEYELTHDYLVAHIARWLGDDFWAAQKGREILRGVLPDWVSRARLLGTDDLRWVAAQRDQMHFSEPELELLYAAAVSYDQNPGDWAASLPAEACQRVLLQLLDHRESFARRGAAHRLAPFSGQQVSEVLARAAMADPDGAVREAAAQSIAAPFVEDGNPPGEAVNREAVAHLVEAAADPATHQAALEALVKVRDRAPACHSLLPEDLRGPVQLRVWRTRWNRRRHDILSRTLRGMQGGFWGLGLGMGLFIGPISVRASGFDRINWQTFAQLLGLGVPIAGVMGTLVAGSGAFARTTLRCLSDQERRWHIWAIVTGLSAVMMGLGFLLFAYIFQGEPQPMRSFLAGLLVGLGLAGSATAPWRLPSPLRLGLSALGGMAAFLLARYLGLIFNQGHPLWMVIMGGASGIGFFLGLNPNQLEVQG